MPEKQAKHYADYDTVICKNPILEQYVSSYVEET